MAIANTYSHTHIHTSSILEGGGGKGQRFWVFCLRVVVFQAFGLGLRLLRRGAPMMAKDE